MKQGIFRFGLWLVLLVCGLTRLGLAADAPREQLSLDAHWRFHLGDNWPNALDLAKAGASGGPAGVAFSDAAWREVNLPHDWAIELPFDQNANVSHGFKPVGPGYATNNVGWYRRTFVLSQADAGKRIWLTFDGVFSDATVWVNGWLVSRHRGGYYPFREDITEVVTAGGTNVIAVKVDASQFEGWFYEGAGIYRHVWLETTAPLALAPNGLFVYPQFKHNQPDGKAQIHIEATLLNTEANRQAATVHCEIIAPDGKPVAKFKARGEVEPGGKTMLKLEAGVSEPVFWSPENPRLYRLITTVESVGQVVDRQETEFGIRTFAFDNDKGFLLNGQPYVLKGTCNHQDHAGVGAALPDALQSFRIARLKEFGCNSYRCSHNPPTPELLAACDHIGMIVMDENRLLGNDSENLRKFEDLILRDRNHASVAIWSIANEEYAVQKTVNGGRVGLAMQTLAKRLDPTRPVTAAENAGNTYLGLMGTLEVRGWNYNFVGASNVSNADDYHREHPNQPNIGTEQGSTVSTRGIYENDKERGYVSAYDENFPSWAHTAEKWWSYFAVRPWLSGGYVWTGFDYRGEPTPYSWPCINSHFGILDTCGFPKDNFYYYQSWWTTNVVLHLLPHWNWAGKEGQEIRVDALSNCEEVELFLNGASLGRKPMPRNSKLTWQVKYAPGMLLAKGYRGGKVIAEKRVETTGEAVALKLTRDLTGQTGGLKADGKDLAIFTVSAVDQQGREVPVAQNQVQLALTGAGKIIGVGNGDPSSHEPDTFVPQIPVRSIPVTDWRWTYAEIPVRTAVLPAYAAFFDDSSWKTVPHQTNGLADGMFLSDWQSAVYRAHVKLTAADLANPGVQLRFGGIDDDGWIYVNGQRIGESLDSQDFPCFDVKHALHPGDNVIAVGVRNYDGSGGLNQDVTVDIVENPPPVAWSRSLFNGLAQVIIQSVNQPGELKLTASAPGLQPASAAFSAQPATTEAQLP